MRRRRPPLPSRRQRFPPDGDAVVGERAPAEFAGAGAVADDAVVVVAEREWPSFSCYSSTRMKRDGKRVARVVAAAAVVAAEVAAAAPRARVESLAEIPARN